MNTKLISKIDALPESLKIEVELFVDFLSTKSQRKASIKSRKFGFAKGKMKMAKDFDAPLEMFKEYMP